jgi:hypothetical protein
MPSRLSIVAAVAATVIMIPVLASAQGPVGVGPGPAGPGPAGRRWPRPRSRCGRASRRRPRTRQRGPQRHRQSQRLYQPRRTGGRPAQSRRHLVRRRPALLARPMVRLRRRAVLGVVADRLCLGVRLMRRRRRGAAIIAVPASAAGGRGCGNAIAGVTVEPGARDGGPP